MILDENKYMKKHARKKAAKFKLYLAKNAQLSFMLTRSVATSSTK